MLCVLVKKQFNYHSGGHAARAMSSSVVNTKPLGCEIFWTDHSLSPYGNDLAE